MTIAKVEKKSQSITPLGGINFINAIFALAAMIKRPYTQQRNR
jgi:hypothetical protein